MITISSLESDKPLFWIANSISNSSPGKIAFWDKSNEYSIRSDPATKEKILVYGDYDVDGTTSVAMMYSFLQKFNKTIEYYIPCRYEEGYGISLKGIDYAKTNNFSLIIALDCGIRAVDQIDYANEKGIDFIKECTPWLNYFCYNNNIQLSVV